MMMWGGGSWGYEGAGFYFLEKVGKNFWVWMGGFGVRMAGLTAGHKYEYGRLRLSWGLQCGG